MPQGFRGEVNIRCVAEKQGTVSIDVDRFGQGSSPTCPGKGSKVFVVRDGGSLPAENLHWQTTGDGIIVGLTFTAPQ